MHASSERETHGRWIDYAPVPGALERLRAAVPVEPPEHPARDPAAGCPDITSRGPVPVQLRITR